MEEKSHEYGFMAQCGPWLLVMLDGNIEVQIQTVLVEVTETHIDQ